MEFETNPFFQRRSITRRISCQFTTLIAPAPHVVQAKFFTFSGRRGTKHAVIRTTTRSRSVGKSALIVALFSFFLLTKIALGASTTLDEGSRAYQRGAFEEAAAKWQKAVEEYRRQSNVPQEIKAMTDLASAYQALGQQRRALALLEEA